MLCGISVDLENAFDTVDHEILCEKLNHYGVHGNVNKLIKSYLDNRKQYVSLQGFDSAKKNIDCGVPQGSSLGSLLFQIYINDFRLCLNETKSGHFADDTFILYNSKILKTIETIVNTELKEVAKWLNLNKLSLNVGKPELFFVHSHQHSLNYDEISKKINGLKLCPMDKIKFLSMHIDKYLSWNYHVQHLSTKLSRANRILSKLRPNAPLETCLQVYYAMFYSHRIYGCNICGLTSEEILNKIEVLQKKCLRIMTFSDFNSHTNPLFINLKLLKLNELIKLHQLKLVFEFYEQVIPTALFTFSSDMHTTNLVLKSAQKNLLYISATKTTKYGYRSMKFYCAKLWNDTFKKGIIIDGFGKNNVSLSQFHNKSHFKITLKNIFSTITLSNNHLLY